MITKISQSTGGALQELFRSLQKEQAELLEKSTEETLNTQALETAGLQSAAGHPTSSSLMSRNFFDYNYERSEYLQANIDGKRLEGSFANKMNSLLNSLTSQAAIWDMERNFGGAVKIENTYVIGTRLATASEQATNRIKQEETSEASEKNLDEIKDEIERKAQEAATPADADGNSAENLSTESAEEDTSMSGISGSNSAPASDVAAVAESEATAATAVASDPALTPEEISLTEIPVTLSIDITV